MPPTLIYGTHSETTSGDAAMSKIYVVGLSLRKGSQAGACMVMFQDINGKYTSRQLIAARQSGGTVVMEVRAVIMALNLLPPGQEVQVESLNKSLVGLVRRAGGRSAADTQHVGVGLRRELRKAIQRHTHVGSQLRHRYVNCPLALRLLRKKAVELLGVSESDLMRDDDRYDGVRSALRKQGAFAAETGMLVQRKVK